MNKHIIGLALAAAVVMPAAYGGVLSVNFTVSGSAGTVPAFSESRDTYFHENGGRFNIVNSTFDEIRDDGNGWGYLVHYAAVTYEVAGYYTDSYMFNGSVSGAPGGPRYAYLSGTVSFDPAAGGNMGNTPATLNASMLFSGNYTPAYDVDFPSIPLPPAEPKLAIGYSNDRADLIAQGGRTSFNDGYFSQTGGAGGVELVAGQNAFEFLFYAGPELDPTMTTLLISGPAYEFGMHQRTDLTLLGYEHVQLPLPVPEPSTWAMLVAGAAIIGVARRRKNPA